MQRNQAVKNKSVYLDTNIFSRITDLKISSQAANAYRALADRQDIKLVTSPKTIQEIKQAPNKDRASVLHFIYSLFEKVPLQASEYSASISTASIGSTPIAGGWTDPLYSELKKIFDPDDAEHIFQAAKSLCDYFLTLDKKSILNRVENNQEKLAELCPSLVFVHPEVIIERLDNHSL